jgi:hypothetical protein
MLDAYQDPLLLPKPSDGLTLALLCQHSHPADSYIAMEEQKNNIKSNTGGRNKTIRDSM